MAYSAKNPTSKATQCMNNAVWNRIYDAVRDRDFTVNDALTACVTLNASDTTIIRAMKLMLVSDPPRVVLQTVNPEKRPRREPLYYKLVMP